MVGREAHEFLAQRIDLVVCEAELEAVPGRELREVVAEAHLDAVRDRRAHLLNGQMWHFTYGKRSQNATLQMPKKGTIFKNSQASLEARARVVGSASFAKRLQRGAGRQWVYEVVRRDVRGVFAARTVLQHSGEPAPLHLGLEWWFVLAFSSTQEDTGREVSEESGCFFHSILLLLLLVVKKAKAISRVFSEKKRERPAALVVQELCEDRPRE